MLFAFSLINHTRFYALLFPDSPSRVISPTGKFEKIRSFPSVMQRLVRGTEVMALH